MGNTATTTAPKNTAAKNNAAPTADNTAVLKAGETVDEATGEVIEDATAETGLAVSNTNTAVATVDEETQTVGMMLTPELAAQTFAALEGMKSLKRGFELTATYHKFVKDENLRGIYAGLQKIKSTKGDNASNSRVDANGDIEVARILCESGKFVIVGDAVVVGTLKTQQVNIPVSITCTGETRGKQGDYKTFAVQYLF